MLAHIRIEGVVVFEAALRVASGIVTVFEVVADTPTVSVAAAAGLSQVIKLQSQVAAVMVIARVSWMPTWFG